MRATFKLKSRMRKHKAKLKRYVGVTNDLFTLYYLDGRSEVTHWGNEAAIKYTREHRKAFRLVEKQLLGYNTMRSLFHDLDKLGMYQYMPTTRAHNIHVKNTRHHELAQTYHDHVQSVIDYECACLTKKDKPLRAREFIYAKKQDSISLYEPILQDLGL